MEYETVIGLEIHAQLKTESKIFCGCSTRFGAPPNHNTCPVCLGMPGVLPVLNRKALEYTLRMALATHCTVAPFSRFARKNYFYPDLPKGYQISQYELPLAEHGYLDIRTKEGVLRVEITRIHMEEDAGKLIHDEHRNMSYIDFNRTGVPLIEIVTEPDLRSGEDAATFMRELRAILQYLDICDGNMEEGSLRCDANISIRPRGSQKLGTKTEIKNMNSFRFVQRALEYEAERQREILEEGGTIVQETRLWDAARNATFPMRSKEYAHDYRYFPDPDLVPLAVPREWIERIHASLPELPAQKRERFVRDYGIPEADAEVLTTSRAMADYYEACVRLFPQAKAVSNWIMTELLRELKNDNREIEDCQVTPEALAGLLRLIEDGTISGKIAKSVFEEMYREGRSALEIVEAKGLRQLADEGQIRAVIQQIMKAYPKEVKYYRGGKEKLFGFFVGQVMKATHGKANPQMVNQLLREELSR
jgi:aspartyl-tRNA(Asn)/glutamyl-tRNA(Gln) amidotransferase subunit B